MKPLIMKGATMQCPVCESDMWDNSSKKTNPKAPDFRCKDKNCKWEMNRETGEYDIPSKFPTSVWLKAYAEVKPQEKVFQGTKPTPPAKINGIEPSMRQSYRKDLMIAVVNKFSDTCDVKALISTFELLWAEIEK